MWDEREPCKTCYEMCRLLHDQHSSSQLLNVGDRSAKHLSQYCSFRCSRCKNESRTANSACIHHGNSLYRKRLEITWSLRASHGLHKEGNVLGYGSWELDIFASKQIFAFSEPYHEAHEGLLWVFWWQTKYFISTRTILLFPFSALLLHTTHYLVIQMDNQNCILETWRKGNDSENLHWALTWFRAHWIRNLDCGFKLETKIFTVGACPLYVPLLPHIRF